MDQLQPNGTIITIIHMVHQVAGKWQIACMPGMVEFHETPYHPSYKRTDDPRAVTCPACKRSEAFTGHMITQQQRLTNVIR